MMIDNAFPVQLGGNNNTVGFLQQYVKGMQGYSQQSTDPRIPTYGIQEGYAQELGGPLIGETLISGAPSFDLSDIERPGYGPEVAPGTGINVLERLYPGLKSRAKTAVPNVLRRAGLLKGV